MPERHTAEYLAIVLSTATEHLGLNRKVTARVHVSASNMVLANTEHPEWHSEHCFAHSLQLAKMTDSCFNT